ncbi:spermidine synthase [Oikeobacillus pervagus]|uniref:Polyamine aminopropyltransferase n=1 Tax=Oikeobacillus pervagus TaxID=1325931 RepID=A0AAJ1T3J6_9BACI|nr:polyamine aminopropyltransferase [Oikeobacillus pervagus]MDQ0214205.1 spermidine synthase [Oikeobacillus pervagus]
MKTYPEWLKEVDGSLWLTEDDRSLLKIDYKIKEVIFSKQSPLQHVMIVDSYDFGKMLILDGVVQTTAVDGHIYNEMISHVPLTLHPHPKKILIIGGGDCGAAREAAKHTSLEQIDMVEIDELVVKASKEYLQEVSGNLSDPRVNFIFTDGIKFVQEKENEYDVIIVDSSDPVGPAEALFEYDFYAHIKQALKKDGIAVFQSQSPIFHREMLKQTYSYTKELYPGSAVFQAVVPTYPGGMWTFTIGTKRYLIEPEKANVPPLETKYFNQDILKGCFLLQQDLKNLLSQE